MKPLITIITTSYNLENYISKCIESVISQTYRNWEMIIIDDASIDKTPQIIKSYMTKDERIKYLRNSKNLGVQNLSESYNRGLGISRGKYIAILEGDDFWPIHKLEKQVSSFDNPAVVLSYGDWIMTDHRGMGIKLEQYANFNNRILFNDPPGSVITSIATFDLFIVSSTVMIRTDTLKKIDGFIQDKYCPFLDIPTYLQLSLIGTFYYQKEILGYYRRHSFSHWYNFAKETETMGWKEMRQGINDFLLQNENKIKKSGIDINIKQIITTQNRKLEHKRKYKNCSLFLNSFLIRNNLLLPFLYLRFLISYSYYVTKKRFL